MIRVFTICSANYLAYAETLGESLARSNPQAAFTIFLADEPPEGFDAADAPFEMAPVSDLDLPELYDMAARYTILEFNTAVKPFCFRHLFLRDDTQAVIYLDPDILALSPFEELYTALENADIVLTPHALAPFPRDGRTPDDTQMMRAGVFNLGFIALRRGGEAARFLDWWGAHLKTECLVKTEQGVFVDQKFCDLAPCYFDNVFILKHPGYNAAYWNLHEREITRHSDGWRVNATAALRFFHFSGVDPDNPDKLSKHQDRFELSALADLPKLMREYCAALCAKRQAAGARPAYAFARLVNGVRLTDEMRRVWGAVQPSAPRTRAEAFAADLAPYLMAEPELAANGVRVPRLLFEIWRRRRDLQLAFPLADASGVAPFAKWFGESVEREYGMDASVVAAVEAALRAQAETGAQGLEWVGGCLRPPQGESFDWIAARGVGVDEPGVDYYGYFRAATGVAAAATKLVGALRAAAVPVTAHEIPGVAAVLADPVGLDFGPPRRQAALFHMNADMTSRFEACMDPRLARRPHRIGFWAWELDSLPLEWLRAFDFVDEVWTPSAFCARVLAQRTAKPVRVIPHPVEPPGPAPDIAACRKAFGLSQNRLVTLIAYDADSYVARKNPLGAVRAFKHAFAGRKDAPQLVIKRHGRASEGEREALARELEGVADVVWITRVLTPQETSALQWACDIYLSLHRAERFGLWIAECMARGKACVATNYSGNVDFADETCSIPIPYAMTAVGEREYPYGAGRRWAEPDQDAAVEALRALAADPDLRAQLGRAARERIARTLAPERIGALAGRRLLQGFAESFVLPTLPVGVLQGASS